MVDNLTRAFIAIEVDDDTRSKISKIQSDLNSLDIKPKNVSPENLHITMKFLGDIDDIQTEKIRKILDNIATNLEPFDVSVVGLGAFPNLDYIKVIWAGILEGEDIIFDIHKKIDQKLAKVGFKKDKRYHPHITFSRIKSAKDKSYLVKLIENNRDRFFSKFRVNSIVLKKSELKPQGPEYEDIFGVLF